MDKSFAMVRAGVFAAAAAILLLGISPVRAQDAGGPIVLSPTNSGSTDALSNAPPARGTVAGERPLGVPLHPLPQQGGNPGGQHANDHALQNNAGKHLNPEPGPLFEGIGQTGYIPPDTNIAVGPNHIVEVVNSEIAVFDKTGAMKSGYPKLLGNPVEQARRRLLPQQFRRPGRAIRPRGRSLACDAARQPPQSLFGMHRRLADQRSDRCL